MNKNYKRLIALSRVIDLNKFFNISIASYELKLLGELSAPLLEECMLKKFKITRVEENGYIRLKRKNIEIVLT